MVAEGRIRQKKLENQLKLVAKLRELEESNMVQALLQVTVKNGLPWFTFAVDNNSDILAATMRKTNSSRSMTAAGYTHFTPSIKCTKSARSDSENQLMVREFVLFEVEPRKADQETSSFLTNVELAAIVIKVRRGGSKSKQ
ncbi:hypothetical protein IFM89_008297 [Coptis chinensis]|uniref:Uncharacterized protein n=1 Tax=Coptis chinensis TaxID=261450 RepID=A0A835LZM0_9MAGN|nr:hypothetical protein IFM89_008297 [Coptis chinensis]